MTALLSAKGELLCKPLQTSHAVRDLFFQLVCYTNDHHQLSCMQGKVEGYEALLGRRGH